MVEFISSRKGRWLCGQMMGSRQLRRVDAVQGCDGCGREVGLFEVVVVSVTCTCGGDVESGRLNAVFVANGFVVHVVIRVIVGKLSW